jgi:signal transduction histidine kinase
MKMDGSAPLSIQEEVKQLRTRILEVERREHERDQLEATLDECLRLVTLTREVSDVLIQENTLQESLQQCAHALVTHLEAALVRIWTFNPQTQILELQASAGMYTHLDGDHSRIRIGDFKIGRIAAQKQPYFTNKMPEDPGDQQWTAREGIVSFVGYPLLVEGELVGMMALFARILLSPAVLEAMASASNAMATSIKRKRVENEHKQAQEERSRLLIIAEQARHDAVAALQVRNDFLASVSHDLKTPIAVMRGNVQLLQRRIKREGMIDPAWSTDRLAVIEVATMKMNTMVEELLDVARLKAGQQLDLDMRSVLLVSLIRQISAEQQAMTKRHQLEITAPTEDLRVWGDRIRLDRILTNLLTNAIKYSPSGGRILIEATQEEREGQQWIVVSISDQGIGIPLADQAHIFDPFYRASNVTGRMQGTGVGLASTAQIIAQHGGEITVRSEEGQGSTFTIRLPLLKNET